MNSFDNKGFLKILMIALVFVIGIIAFIFWADGSNILEQIGTDSKGHSESTDSNDDRIEENDNYKLELNDKGVLNVDKIKEIEIDCVSTDIRIKTTNDDELKVQFKGTYFGKESSAPTLQINEYGDTATIEVKYPKNSGLNSISLSTNLEIELPEKYKEKIQINTVSSDIDMIEIRIRELELDLVSGDVTIDSFYGELDAETVSGDVKVNIEELANDINFSTTSGQLSIKVPEESSFLVNLNTVSGEVDCDLPMEFTNKSRTEIEGKAGSGEYKIKCNSVSGDVNIEK